MSHRKLAVLCMENIIPVRLPTGGMWGLHTNPSTNVHPTMRDFGVIKPPYSYHPADTINVRPCSHLAIWESRQKCHNSVRFGIMGRIAARMFWVSFIFNGTSHTVQFCRDLSRGRIMWQSAKLVVQKGAGASFGQQALYDTVCQNCAINSLTTAACLRRH